MQDTAQLALFFAAALVLAVTPGPGVFYVAARALSGGRAEGVASSLGTGLGGTVHVLAGSLGVSAVVLASAELFAALKLLGAAYLVWIGLGTVRAARRDALAALGGGAAVPPVGGAARLPRRCGGGGAEPEDGGLLPRLRAAGRGPGRG